MKGFKTRVGRPGSARPKTGLVPGVTEASSPDFHKLFLNSQQKDVIFKQIEFEKSRSKLLLHIEAKKSQDEKDVLANKYEETIRNMMETNQNRMKALAQQHEIATEVLMDQFKREINMLKNSHKAAIDRLFSEHQGQIGDFVSQIEEIKKKDKENTGKKEAEYKKKLDIWKEKCEKNYQLMLYDASEKFEREKREFCENAIKERDGQVKELISKLYEECRKEWKTKETQMAEEIKTLRSQIEKFHAKETNMVKENFEFAQSEIEVFSENFNDFAEDPHLSDFVTQKSHVFKSTQTENLSADNSSQTEYINEFSEQYKALENAHIFEIQEIEAKITDTLQKKNVYIRHLESQLHQNLQKNKELEGLIKQLKC